MENRELLEWNACQRRMAEEREKSQLHLWERFEEGKIRLSEKQAEADISARKEIAVYREKKIISERYQALKKEERESIGSDETGSLMIIKKNPLFNLGPGEVSNMTMPKLTKIIKNRERDSFCYRLTCKVGGEERTVYFDRSKITEIKYVSRKLANAGIVLYGRAKKLLPEIFAYLISQMTVDDEETVPEKAGWFMNWQNKLGFRKVGEMTWEKSVVLCR